MWNEAILRIRTGDSNNHFPDSNIQLIFHFYKIFPRGFVEPLVDGHQDIVDQVNNSINIILLRIKF